MKTFIARTDSNGRPTAVEVHDHDGRRDAAERFAARLPSALRAHERIVDGFASEVVVITDPDGTETRWMVDIELEVRVRARPMPGDT